MTNNTEISFEFFPPKTPEGREKLLRTREALSAFAPAYFSVTYGAGGSTRDFTRDIVLEIAGTGSVAAPHISFGGDTEEAVLALLDSYKETGINHIVALRGDMPSGMGRQKLVHANELVALIRKHSGDHFKIMVAAYPEIHPEAENYPQDIYWLGQKFSAGADYAITQYFYNPDAYFYFMEQCQKAGVDKPIIPGIMPITNYQSLARFSDNCGADIPRWIRQRLQSFGDDKEGLRQFGEEVVTHLCEQLLSAGVPGLHFYTLNQAAPSSRILQNLGLKPTGL